MRTSIFCVLFFLACAFAKHTVHVDQIYPNFGDTVHVSGPFTTDDITTEVFNVGRLTINSEEGLAISTDSSFQIDSANFEASGDVVSLRTSESSGNIAIVASATMDILADSLSLGSDATFSVTALGSFEFFSSGLFSLSADSATLAGESLSLSSVSGSLSFNSANDTWFRSPALSLFAKKDISFLSSSDISLDIQQAIDMHANYVELNGENISMNAERNNVFLQGYTGLHINTELFDVQAKGDATIASANGNLIFSGMSSIRFNAEDDIVLESNDAVRFTADDLHVSSSGTTYFLADSHSIFNSESTIDFSGRQGFSVIAGSLYAETSNGNVNLSSSGTFTSESADYTHVLADVDLTLLASRDINLNGEQGLELTSENRFFIGKTSSSATGNSAPISFTAEEDLFFDGGDVRVNSSTFAVQATDVRFETSTGTNSNVQDWNVGGTSSIDVGGMFQMKSTGLELVSAGDLDLVGGAGVSFIIEGNQGAGISISNRFDAVDSADFINTFANTFSMKVSGDTTITALDSLDFTSPKEDVTFDSNTFIEVTSPSLSQLIAWDSVYQTGGDFSLISTTDNVDFLGGFAEFDIRGAFAVTGDVASFQAFNVDFDADESASYVADVASFQGSDYLIINGDQLYDEYETVMFTGSVSVSSPPSTAVGLNAADLGVAGSITFGGYDIIFDLEDAISFTPFVFNMDSDAEENISFVSDVLDVNGDDITMSTEDRDRDTEFLFQAADAFTMAATTSLFEFTQDSTITTESTSFTANSGTFINEETVVQAATDLDLTAASTMTFNNYNSLMEADQSILFDVEEAQFTSGQELFFRTENIQFFAEQDVVMAHEGMSLAGGSAVLDTDTSFTLNSETAISFFASSSADLQMDDFELTFAEYLDFEGSTNQIFGDEVTFAAEPFLSLITNEHLPFVLEANGGTATFLAEEIRYDSTDMFLVSTGESWVLNSVSLYQESSAQDAGLLYFADESFSYDIAGSITVAVEDGSLHGKDIRFNSSEFAEFLADGSLTMSAEGSEYDDHANNHVGMLFRVSDEAPGTISLDSGADLFFTAHRSLDLLAFNGDITHTSTAGDIEITSTDQGMAAGAGNQLSFQSEGTFSATLAGYSIWTATGSILFDSEDGIDVNVVGDIDMITDRGEVFLRHDGVTDSLDITAGTSITGYGAAESTYRMNNGNFVGNSIELFGDSALELESELAFTIDALGDSHIISSLHNDIHTETAFSTVTVGGALDLYAVDEIFWINSAVDVINTITAANDINMISEGSIDISGAGDGTFSAAAGLAFSGLNYITFDASDSMLFGDGTSLITLTAGGDTLDYGISISTEETVSYTSTTADMVINSDRFYSYTEGAIVTATNTFLMNSRGGGVDGSDISLSSEEGSFLLSSVNSEFTGGSLHFDLAESLSFTSGLDTTISSATFIDIDSSGEFSLTSTTGTWTIESESQSFASDGDTTFSATQNSIFTVGKTVSSVAHGDIAVESAGSSIFSTEGSNSPITFATLSPITEFTMDTLSTTFTSISKTSVSAEDGVSFETGGNSLFSSADDFIATAGGDMLMYGSDFLMVGDPTPGTGSQMIFSSAGGLTQNYLSQLGLNAGTTLLIDADKDIIIHAIRDEGPLISDSFILFQSTSITGTMGGDYVFDSDQVSVAVTATDMIFNGVWSEVGIGAVFASADIDMTTFAASLLADRIYVEGEVSTMQGSVSTFNAAEDGISFATYGVNGDIDGVTDFGKISFSATEILSVSGLGSDQSSGYINLEGTSESAGILYPNFFDGLVSVAMVAHNSSLSIDAEASKFVLKGAEDVQITPGENGEVFLRAAGADANGVGISVESTELRISSALNVNMRAENIFFHELAHAEYYYDVFQFSFNSFSTYRPQLRSLHDQSYTALGRNVNGNGIELLSDVPSLPFFFDVNNLNFGSSGSLSILAAKGVFVEADQLDVISHGNMVISGEGNAEDMHAIQFLVVGDATFRADDDLLIESSRQILIDIDTLLEFEADTVLLEGGSINAEFGVMNIVSQFSTQIIGEKGVEIETLNMQAQSDEFFIEAGANAAYSRGDVYFGNPAGSTGSGSVLLETNEIIFDARVVDIPSDNALIFPIRDVLQSCPPSVETFYFVPAFNGVTLVYCRNGFGSDFDLL